MEKKIVSDPCERLMGMWEQRANNYMLSRGELLGAFARFVEYGILPGSFLTSVLENNLRESFAHADELNKANLFWVVSFCYNVLPRDCWGSPENVNYWVAKKNDQR